MKIQTIFQFLRNLLITRKQKQNNGFILIVEDNNIDRDYFAQSLMKERYRIEIIKGDNLVEFARNTRPILIIIGTFSDGKSIDLCAKLKKSDDLRVIPILVLAVKEDTNIAEYYRLNVEYYFQKPISKKKLIKQVKLLTNKEEKLKI